MRKLLLVLLSVCLLSVFLFGCDAVSENNPTSSTTTTTTTTTETTTTTTTSTTTTTVPTTTTTAKRLTPQEAVAIVKGKLPAEKAYLYVDHEGKDTFLGKEYYRIHVYSLSEELLDGDQGPYRQMFTYAWLYVDIQTGEVFQDAPRWDDPVPIVPWPGEEAR